MKSGLSKPENKERRLRFLFSKLFLGAAVVALLCAPTHGRDVKLEWDSVSGCEKGSTGCPISHFNIYVSTTGQPSSATDWKLVGHTPPGRPEVTTFHIQIPEDGVTRYFSVTAVDVHNQESAFSNIVGISALKIRVEGSGWKPHD